MKTCDPCDRHSGGGVVSSCCLDCIHRVKGEPQDYWKPIVLGEPCASCTGRVRANNPARCAECSPTLHNNFERTPGE